MSEQEKSKRIIDFIEASLQNLELQERQGYELHLQAKGALAVLREVLMKAQSDEEIVTELSEQELAEAIEHGNNQ